MEATYRLHIQGINPAFLKSLKALFAGKEVEITVKAVQEAEVDHHQPMENFIQIGEEEKNLSHMANPTFNALKLETRNFKFERDEANAR